MDAPVVVPATPYRGIQPFRYVDHAIFFEREDETRQLTSLVAVYRGVLLYGDSGNGKSSLINAGLLPAAAGRGLYPERLRVQPRAGEEIVIERITVSDDGRQLSPSLLGREDDDAPRLVLSVEAFEERVRQACATHRPLLVFDQFEEILTLFESEDAHASRKRIVETIVQLLHEPLPVKLVFAFREDYLGKVKQLLAASPELVDQALRLGPPQVDALPSIIRGPFERHPGHFARELQPPLAERLRAALEERFGQGDLSLSEVQTVCLRLWQAPDDPEALLAEKGVQGLLEDYLGEALDALTPDVREAAVALLSQMVTSAGTRNVISADDLIQRVRAEEDIPLRLLEQALEQLESESKLVRRERRRDLFLYEITSEFLVPWISRRREELRRVQERRRERQRLLRVLASITGALLLIAITVVVAGMALKPGGDPRQAATAASLALASAAQGPLSDRPDVSLLLAFEAYRERSLPEARGAIIQSLRAAGRPAVVGILHGHNDAVLDLAASPDGHTLATAGADGTARLWDTRTHRQIARLTGHIGPVTGVAFSRDGLLATAGEDRTVRLWGTRTFKQLFRLTGHSRTVNGVAFNPRGHTLATSGFDGIRLWDTRTGKQIARLSGRGGGSTGIAFSRDGHTLATADFGGIGLWDTRTRKQTGRLIQRAGGGPAPTLALSPDGDVAFSTDGHTLATSSPDGTARVWDIRTRKPLARLTGHGNSVTDVAFSPDAHTLATISIDGTARLWDTRTHRQLSRLADHKSTATAVAIMPDGFTVAIASYDGTARLWDTRKHLSRVSGHRGPVRVVAFSPDGDTLATAGDDGTVRLWDKRTHKQRAVLHHRRVIDVAFSPDGHTLATAGFDGSVHLWDARTHEQIARLTGRTVPVSAVAFGPENHTLATAGFDGNVRLWNSHTRRQLARFNGLTGPLLDIAFSRDGHTLATAGIDSTIVLWDTRTRKQTYPLAGHIGTVNSVAFSPDSHTLASAGSDGTARLWDTRTHKQVHRLTGHTGRVNAVAFSRDGQTLATAGTDKTARLWDTRTRKQLARLTGQSKSINDVAFSRDGRILAIANADRTVGFWTNIYWRDVVELRDLVCDLVGTGLSRAEWDQYVTEIPYRNSCP